jgi:hypothetical protein
MRHFLLSSGQVNAKNQRPDNVFGHFSPAKVEIKKMIPLPDFTGIASNEGQPTVGPVYGWSLRGRIIG